MLAINNMPDHLHFFVGLNPNQSTSEMMRLVKCDSSELVNKEKLTSTKFHWQEGYGAFSHSKTQIDTVVKYITVTFLDEYRAMLEKAGIAYDEKYIFKLPE